MRHGKLLFAILAMGAALTASAAGSDLGANVRNFGAAGDGKTDDTQAILKAIASLPKEGGVVYFPPGRYLTRTIPGKSFVTFLGHSSWGHTDSEWGSFAMRAGGWGSTVISPVSDDLRYLFDLTESIGTRLVGLTLDGMNKGAKMHGVYSKRAREPQNMVIDDCKIMSFSGSGIRLDKVWVFAIRHSLIIENKLSGIDGSGSCDGWILDSQISGNGHGGIFGTSFATVTITANRIEHNQGGGILLGPGSVTTVQISNCTMDRNWGPGISIVMERKMVAEGRWISANSITGNLFRRNGFRQQDPDLNCHLRLENLGGATVTGNSMFGGPNSGDAQRNWPQSPLRGMILQGLIDSVVTNNSLFEAASEQLIVDRGGHTGAIIRDNPGRLWKPKAPASPPVIP